MLAVAFAAVRENVLTATLQRTMRARSASSFFARASSPDATQATRPSS
jgi:hypothetical protein